MRSAVCDMQCDFATADAALLALRVGVITIFIVTTVASACMPEGESTPGVRVSGAAVREGSRR